MSAQPELRRDLGMWAASSIVVGTVIGSGIFLVPSDMIRAVGSPEMVFAVWIFGGFLSLFGALTYAELSAAMPEAGGEYVYLNAAYGPMWGFVYGWTQMWVAKAASIATLATAFFLYFANFFPGLDGVWVTIGLPIGPRGGPLEIRYGQLLGMAVIFFLAGVNYLGVKVGGAVQVGVTLLKVAMILALIVIGLGSGVRAGPGIGSTVAAQGGMSGFFAALVAALWAYDGWNNAGMAGSEIRRPEKNLPLALILGTLVVILLYLGVNVAYFLVLSGPEVGASQRVAADMMRRILGEPGAGVVSAAAMMSIFAALNGSILSGSRVPYAMARDGFFFRRVASVHPTFRTPGVSIILLSSWAAVLLLSGRYDDLYNTVIFSSFILYGMTAASVIVLRRKNPALKRPYKVLGYPLVPILFVLVSALLLYSQLLRRPRESLLGLALISIGFPFYFHWKRRRIG